MSSAGIRAAFCSMRAMPARMSLIMVVSVARLAYSVHPVRADRCGYEVDRCVRAWAAERYRTRSAGM